ncbi:protein canopy homolog 2 isoform 2-T3 [Vipera latastei]
MNDWISSTVCLLLLLSSVCIQKSQDLRCGACRALVDELEWEISRVDLKKTIQVGSFRINPDGSQSIVEVPYARSEAHLMELLENICENMNNYALLFLKRRTSKSSACFKKVDSENCEKIAEEYEDELMEFFSHEAENVKDRLCSKRTDLCDHALHLPHDEL